MMNNRKISHILLAGAITMGAFAQTAQVPVWLPFSVQVSFFVTVQSDQLWPLAEITVPLFVISFAALASL
jgi:hypothetical protein